MGSVASGAYGCRARFTLQQDLLGKAYFAINRTDIHGSLKVMVSEL